MAEHDLKEKTAKGLFWGGINNGGQQLLNLIFGIFLARLLSPADYGIVGMLTIFSLIAGALQESGFISGLNRKKNITQADYNAVFWFNVLCSLTVYIILYAAAPLIADWFKQPVLKPLARLSFLSFVISSFGTTPRAYLFRNLQVKETATLSIAALFISGITGIALAWNGFAYWGIAIQTLVFCFCTTVLSWYISGWRPSPRIDLRPLRGMVGFSSRLLITNIFTHINNNLFSIFFGRFYGERMVGYYNQANKWTGIGYSTLTGMVWNVTQPVFARLEDDAERRCRAFRKMLRFTAFISCPAMFGLALTAPEFIIITITEKWLPSAGLMQILCVGGAFIPITSLYSNFVISQGRSNVFMYSTVALCLLQTGSLFLLHPYGVRIMVVTYVFINLLWLPVWHFTARRLILLSFRQALLDMLPFALMAGAAMGGAWIAAWPLESIWLRITVKIAVAAFLYLGAMRLLEAAVLTESIEFLRGKLRDKKTELNKRRKNP